MSSRKFDIRQSRFYGVLQQLLPYLTFQSMDVVTESIDSDLTPPLRATASNPANLVVNIGPTIVSNPYSERQRSPAFVNGVVPYLASGTVTFPSASGGNITTSTGQMAVLTVPSNQYVQVLLSIDYLNNLQVQVGVPAASAALAAVPPPDNNYLPYAYVTIFNNAGTIANIAQDTIFQMVGAEPNASGSATGPLWIAQEVSLLSGTTELSITFPTPQTDTSYIVLPMMENLTDPHPQFQQVQVTSKTVSGFTVQWSMALDTANYVLSYIVPPKTLTYSETDLGSGVSNPTLNNPIFQQGSIYPVLSVLENFTDANPQFQPITVTNKSSTSTMIKYSQPTDTANYEAVAVLTATAQLALSSGVSSATIPLHTSYGADSYGVFVTMSNTTDPNPRYQSLLVTGKTANSITVSWNDPLDTANYALTAYTISIAV